MLAPTGRDAGLAARVLDEAEMPTKTCLSIADLRQELLGGAGAIVLTEEALTPEGVDDLAAIFSGQLPWSDLPVLVFCATEARAETVAFTASVPVGEKVVDAILRLVRSARPDSDGPKEIRDAISWAPGPRASQALMLAVRAKAMIEGRLAPSVDDVVELAEPVLKHRMALTFSARAEGRTIPDVIRQLKTRIG